ncbi:MAG: PASTA domain-containing protein [Sphingobacteriales bacterium]|nr:MAG: PASTA domain-containing protein [Sphingobacteriales bacterium]TAF79100.1 MAG: PASTA domain-containing protein [Sphingobacteriales bacterium]
MNIRTNILLRVYAAFGIILLFACAVIGKLVQVQVVQGPHYRAMAKSFSTKYVEVEASRGNIYAIDGSLLATSVPQYEVRMDMLAGGIKDDKLFYDKVDSLGAALATYFKDKSARDYTRKLRNARQDKQRYFLIKRDMTYQNLKAMKKFPMFNLGRYKGGMITIQQNKRILPFRNLAARTIGYKNENVKNGVGLEGAYGQYINGESGKRLVQRISGGVWMPVNEEDEIAPKDGADIISTIDINMQDLAQNALQKQLVKSQADHGTVIVMEVATGEIRAVANFTKVSDGVYKEQFNYAIAGNQDPGSTFKLASYMALLEDKLIDTNTMVGTGTYKIPGKVITDSHGSIGVVTVKKAFEQSSNAAIAKLVNTNYRFRQSKFTNHLYNWHLNEKLELQIPGEAQPVVKTPRNTSWNKNMTLPQMAYGYEMQLTPLKMLSFYNAVANNGKYISPIFVKEIKRLGNSVEQFKARVINPKICSDVTLSKVKAMLEGVVTEGSGKLIVYNPLYNIAGKTGTAQVADGNKGYKANKQYQASFVGYFPAENPKYSMIVVINDPKGLYYGALVSGPVFREVADHIFASDMDMLHYANIKQKTTSRCTPQAKQGYNKANNMVYNSFGIKTQLEKLSTDDADSNSGIAYKEVFKRRGIVPNVTGMGLKDALYVLGNSGLKPIISGSGQVTNQSILAGTPIIKGTKILIALQ